MSDPQPGGDAAERIRRLRAELGLTQAGLAALVGVSPATVRQWESGASRPSPRSWQRLVRSALHEVAGPDPRPTAWPVPTGPERAAPSGSILPQPLGRFVGRASEVADALQALEQSRLLTMTGPGGSGKTRLAIEIAHRWRRSRHQSVWLVDLGPVDDVSSLLPAVASALSLREARGVHLTDAVAAVLRPAPALLVLDSCEHLVAACAALADQLLRGCPRLRILATSRERLRLAGETVWPVPPLSLPATGAVADAAARLAADAVEFFLDRAHAAHPDFTVTGAGADAVVEICRRLGGLPLAIELAAARTTVLTTEQILERLNEPFRLLTGGGRAASTRQQTLAATLDWSYTLLSDRERALFRRLSVFPGAFTVADVEAVAVPEDFDRWAVLDAMTGLVDKSLLLAERAAEPAARYRLLEPIRQYAAAHLATEAEAAEAHARHATHYLHLAEHAAAELHGPDQEQWLAGLDREQANLRAALQWALEHAETERGLCVAAALVPYWEVRGHLSEGRRWLEAMLARAAGAPPSLRVRALTGAGHLAYLQGEDATAEGLLRDGLAVARQAGDAADAAAPLTELGMVRRLRGDLAESERCLREGLARYRASDDRAGVAFALLHLGATAAERDEVARAMALFEESLTIWEALGDRRHVVFIWSLLGIYAVQQGDPDTAVGYLTRSLAEHRRLGDRWKLLNDLLGLAWVLLARGKLDDAARLLGAAEARGEGPGDPVPRIDSVTFRPLLETVRPRRDEPAFAAAWAAGRAMALDAAVDHALAAVATPAAARAAPARSRASEPLTRREREVARLLAQGWSDRQIADALSISISTVGVHVHHILAKLGLHSRWQVGAAASAGALPGRVAD